MYEGKLNHQNACADLPFSGHSPNATGAENEDQSNIFFGFSDSAEVRPVLIFGDQFNFVNI